MSGVVILLSRKTWGRLGGFADGFLGVDNAIHQAARDLGYRVYLMEGVYVYHWYRADAESSAQDGNSEIPATLPINSTTRNGKARKPADRRGLEDDYNKISDIRYRAASQADGFDPDEWSGFPMSRRRRS